MIPTAAKRWKQQIQYELQGEDYQSLIYTTEEEISILPFYTAENVKRSFNVTTDTQAAISLFVSDKEQTLKRIAFWQAKNIGFFLLTLHKQLKKEEVRSWLPTTSLFVFADEVIDTTLYQNAGATMAQQIALTIAELKEQPTILPSICVKMAISEAFLLEIAKLRALRWLLNETFPTYTFQLISEVSNRGLSLLKTLHNEQYVQLAYEAAILGGSDYLLPKNPLFFKKSNLNIEKTQIALISSLCSTRKASLLNDLYAVEALSYEMYKKAQSFISYIEKEGGIQMMKQQRILQKWIIAKAHEAQKRFDKQCEAFLEANRGKVEWCQKEEWELYPFSKKSADRGTLMAKRLWEPFEIKQRQQWQKKTNQ